eukprot:Rhum_TRINITY_DN13453_c0_g1::Rhum_TRINITY_DN13453_c0_g1_i1::g.60243::m.60243
MAQKRSIADMVAEEEREAARRAAKKKEQDEKMAKMAAKLAAAQESIKQRTTADQKRLIQAEQQDRRKFIDSTESEANTEEFRQSKRSTLEVAANAAKDKNFQELVRKRQNHVWQREAAVVVGLTPPAGRNKAAYLSSFLFFSHSYSHFCCRFPRWSSFFFFC